ncbi:MAG: hypothetical protein J7L31_06560 [Thermoplasmata archaeon]|nr:hypothetical protein [Thermoplasmata archaeon]
MREIWGCKHDFQKFCKHVYKIAYFVYNFKFCLQNRAICKQNGGGERIEEHEIFKKAISKWGINAQVHMAIEEMAELIQVLMKYPRKENHSTLNEVIEEIVDVDIMLEQLKMIFITDAYAEIQYSEFRQLKLKRLEEMLKGDEP